MQRAGRGGAAPSACCWHTAAVFAAVAAHPPPPPPPPSLPCPQKTWHPGRVQNLEEVWKREQEAAKEEQKVKEYAKQLQEERAREELAGVAQAAGHVM